MRKLLTKKTSLLAVLACVIGLGSAAGAFGYFTGAGSGVTHTDGVGTSSNMTVSFGTVTGMMYPGAGFDIVPYTVLNAGSGTQELSAVAPTINSNSNGDVTVAGTAVTGCKAVWFTASVGTPALPVTLLPNGGGAGDAFTGTLTVSMIDSGTNQNVCQSVTPDITVSAS